MSATTGMRGGKAGIQRPCTTWKHVKQSITPFQDTAAHSHACWVPLTEVRSCKMGRAMPVPGPQPTLDSPGTWPGAQMLPDLDGEWWIPSAVPFPAAA